MEWWIMLHNIYNTVCTVFVLSQRKKIRVSACFCRGAQRQRLSSLLRSSYKVGFQTRDSISQFLCQSATPPAVSLASHTLSLAYTLRHLPHTQTRVYTVFSHKNQLFSVCIVTGPIEVRLTI